MLEPKYCENIIVGVKFNKKFDWYLTQKDLWKMDYPKLYESIKEQYERLSFSQKKFEYDVGSFEYFCGTRFGIAVLDEKTADKFLEKISKYKMETDKLQEMFLSSDPGDKVSFVPALYVDFDSRILYSYFPEPEDFEGFVPKNWTGVYKNFYGLIKKEFVYWE